MPVDLIGRLDRRIHRRMRLEFLGVQGELGNERREDWSIKRPDGGPDLEKSAAKIGPPRLRNGRPIQCEEDVLVRYASVHAPEGSARVTSAASGRDSRFTNLILLSHLQSLFVQFCQSST